MTRREILERLREINAGILAADDESVIELNEFIEDLLADVEAEDCTLEAILAAVTATPEYKADPWIQEWVETLRLRVRGQRAGGVGDGR